MHRKKRKGVTGSREASVYESRNGSIFISERGDKPHFVT